MKRINYFIVGSAIVAATSCSNLGSYMNMEKEEQILSTNPNDLSLSESQNPIDKAFVEEDSHELEESDLDIKLTEAIQEAQKDQNAENLKFPKNSSQKVSLPAELSKGNQKFSKLMEDIQNMADSVKSSICKELTSMDSRVSELYGQLAVILGKEGFCNSDIVFEKKKDITDIQNGSVDFFKTAGNEFGLLILEPYFKDFVSKREKIAEQLNSYFNGVLKTINDSIENNNDLNIESLGKPSGAIDQQSFHDWLCFLDNLNEKINLESIISSKKITEPAKLSEFMKLGNQIKEEIINAIKKVTAINEDDKLKKMSLKELMKKYEKYENYENYEKLTKILEEIYLYRFSIIYCNENLDSGHQYIKSLEKYNEFLIDMIECKADIFSSLKKELPVSMPTEYGIADKFGELKKECLEEAVSIFEEWNKILDSKKAAPGSSKVYKYFISAIYEYMNLIEKLE